MKLTKNATKWIAVAITLLITWIGVWSQDQGFVTKQQSDQAVEALSKYVDQKLNTSEARIEDLEGGQSSENHSEIGFENAYVTRIVDGDTFEISSGEKIRMLGIDTPERDEPLYQEASDRLSDLILRRDIRLKKDVSQVDRYGRLLRHVYLGSTWINQVMIEEGLAKMVVYPPDVSHVKVLKEKELEAIEKNVGLWQN